MQNLFPAGDGIFQDYNAPIHTAWSHDLDSHVVVFCWTTRIPQKK
ncbi:unnamed protein product, partial [Larinioides sclopetarius]